MPAYMIVNLEVKDPVAFDQYKSRTGPLIVKHGGEFLVRGGKLTVLEGDWKPGRVVIVRFPDAAAAQAFYDDPEYKPLIALRQRAAKTDLVVVEGA
ncbi:MAG TPA: DUF1330 domain-containing protein [Terriglobales bacterium]|nr:DUF1330 domain-containing protein [Terriglobales bacterium]